MKTIAKSGMILALITTVAVFTSEAQPGPGRGPYGGGPGHGRGFGPDSCHMQLMVEDLSDALSLSDKQKADILDLHYVHIQEMKSISEQYRNDCVGERNARIASREKMDVAVKKILTADQLTKYDEFMAERRGPHGQYHRHWN